MTDAHPLQVLPDLAVEVGLYESLILQQLHYWTGKSDDEGWVYNTLAEWQEQLPWTSADTIKRTFRTLRERGLVEVAKRHGSDRTNSYRLNYANLKRVLKGKLPSWNGAKPTPSPGQPAPMSNNNSETTQRSNNTGSGAASKEEAPLSHILADLVARNDPDGKRPNVTKRWAQDEDRLQRLDGRSPAQIEVVIRWCQADDFWRSNIQSMRKLRAKYPALVQKATSTAPERSSGKPAARADAEIKRLDEARKRLEAEGR